MDSNSISYVNGKNATTPRLGAVAVFKWNFLLAAQSPNEQFMEVSVIEELGNGFCRK